MDYNLVLSDAIPAGALLEIIFLFFFILEDLFPEMDCVDEWRNN